MPSGMVKLVESAVFTPPGAMALTRMFALANSMASERVSWMMAPLVMQ